MKHWEGHEPDITTRDQVWNYFSLDEYVTPHKKRGLAWPMVRAFQRWNEVKRLMKHRIAAGQDGWCDTHGWMAVISNILSVTAGITGRDATVKNLEWFCGLMKMPPFEVAAYAFRNNDDVLISPRAAGIALRLTKEERAANKIRTIDAEDELKRDRQRRLNREAAERARRKKGSKPRSESIPTIARRLGISVSTVKRRIQRGEPVSS